eukprot:gnl/TRDRNA2_/TRDRNA2_163592_c1_seq1.p1 gnl/TRDRNA2_/TRDRNA2_163592_c1~~gnl/TRDRNA2_/TRDRNA2_163592_c1_seq1.p1  ORF type:complete len:318 (-),score=43.98 gnl/TRDRNA2_/TRDRNA2_163592_c1_seq1:125-1078(-)
MVAKKTKVIAGIWSAVGGGAGIYTYRYLRDFEEHVPCVQQAVREMSVSAAARRTLGDGELKVIRWTQRGDVDDLAGRARANFRVDGPSGSAHVYMSAKKRRRPFTPGESIEDDDDFVEQGRFWYYWSRPWELKIAFMNKLRALRGVPSSAPAVSLAEWDLDALFFLPRGDASCPAVLVGDARGLPEYEAVCIRHDAAAKDDRSRRRLHLLLVGAGIAAALAGCLRVYRSIFVSRSYNYATKFALTHPTVASALGPASVQTSSGTFGATFINARLRLVGEKGAVADVDFAATRDGASSKPWRIALAKMSHAGKTHSLA